MTVTVTYKVTDNQLWAEQIIVIDGDGGCGLQVGWLGPRTGGLLAPSLL